MKRIFVLLLSSFLLFSCAQNRDIFDPETAKNFKNKNIESPVFGDPNAKIQLMIFSDFQCPACINFEKNIGEKLFNEYVLTNKIGLTFKNFPLDIHVNAPEDALAGLCAHEQDKFKEFSNKMYTLEDIKKGLRLTKEDRRGLAGETGLDMANFDKCVEEGRYVDKIKKDMSEGQKIGLPGTPSIYANGTLLNYENKDGFFSIIDGLIK